ncbi:MAG: IS1595 family transposase [Boseongicola sp. SB0673_bin_14]|nr:IS1595 family transposase [Boseongicola sp. SB0673_bin_14]
MRRGKQKMPSGPGRSYRNGITLIELMDMFPDEESAERWFESVVWPEVRHCPECKSDNTYTCSGKAKMPYRCRDCLKYFSVKTGTVMRNSPMPLRKWAIAIFMNLVSLKGVSSMRVHRDLGITQKSAWFMQHRIREAFKEDASLRKMFENAIEADESYFGGRKKKHVKGRGPVGKAIVAGIKERDSKKVRVAVIPNTKKPTLHQFVLDNIDPTGATLFTDENRSYTGVVKDHQTVVHSAGEYVRGMAHVNGMESFWAVLKRAYHGTFHQISKKHLHRYVTEFAGRHNVRSWDTIEQMRWIASSMVGRSLSYEELTGKEQ